MAGFAIAAEILASAQRIVSDATGATATLRAIARLAGSDRSAVYRCVVDGAAGVASVVIKQALAGDGEKLDPTSSRGAAWRLFNEWAGLQFVAECARAAGATQPLPIASFFGADRALGFVVMEDLGDGKRLDHALLGDDPAEARARLTEWMAALGRMHAVTAGRSARYDEIRAALGPNEGFGWGLALAVDRRRPFDDKLRSYREQSEQSMKWLKLAPPAACYDELEELVRLLREPDELSVYCHRDACPDNTVASAGGMKLIDFEVSDISCALIDARCPRAMFPTCWCANRLPDDVVAAVEAAYRSELVRGCPAAADDVAFGKRMVAACATAALGPLAWGRHLPFIVDSYAPLGAEHEVRLVVTRLRALMSLSHELGYFGRVAALAGDIVDVIQARLPRVDLTLPLYPAFRSSHP